MARDRDGFRIVVLPGIFEKSTRDERGGADATKPPLNRRPPVAKLVAHAQLTNLKNENTALERRTVQLEKRVLGLEKELSGDDL